jgi:hypothetical protein
MQTTTNITDKVKTFDDVLAITGTTLEAITQPNDTPDELAYKKLKLIAQALNEGWVPDWTNGEWDKYYPWFWMNSGSGLSLGAVFGRDSGSAVGSRLCFKSEELAKYAAETFIDIYTEFFILK